jgi:hypothetical protein
MGDKLGIENRNEFMLGGIAPDIHGLMGVPKGVTHFKDTDFKDDNSEITDYINKSVEQSLEFMSTVGIYY